MSGDYDLPSTIHAIGHHREKERQREREKLERVKGLVLVVRG